MADCALLMPCTCTAAPGLAPIVSVVARSPSVANLLADAESPLRQYACVLAPRARSLGLEQALLGMG